MDNSNFASHLLGLSSSATPRWLRAWSLFSIKESDHRKQRCPAQCVCLCLLWLHALCCARYRASLGMERRSLHKLMWAQSSCVSGAA